MNSRFIIIAILISIKVTGIASRAKADTFNYETYTKQNQTTCRGYQCNEDTPFDRKKIKVEEIIDLDNLCKKIDYRLKDQCLDTWKASL